MRVLVIAVKNSPSKRGSLLSRACSQTLGSGKVEAGKVEAGEDAAAFDMDAG